MSLEKIIKFVIIILVLILIIVAAAYFIFVRPTILQASPNFGPVGTVVTLHGSGFTLSDNSIFFGYPNYTGYLGNFGSSNGGKVIQFTIPSGLSGCQPEDRICTREIISVVPREYKITVKNKRGASNSVTFTVAPGRIYKFSFETTDWKPHKGRGFEILVPPQWHENPRGTDQLILTDNSPYYLNFGVTKVNEYSGSTESKTLFEGGKLIKAEEAVLKSLCANVGSCGVIVGSQTNPVAVEDGIGVDFMFRYPGIRVDEPRGFTNELHRTILKNNTLYRFWTSEIEIPFELRDEYPRLEPRPSEIFRAIVQTFRTL